jgi:ketosteroid isomerase-like protein
MTINHDAVISDWIAATNSHDTARFLTFFTPDAVLEDPSVGEVFEGHEGVGQYFDSYFVGYNTQTRLVRMEPRDGILHIEVDFTGDFPGGQTAGTFDITLVGDMISHVRADLV